MTAKAVCAESRQIVSFPKQTWMTTVRPSITRKPEKVTAGQYADIMTLPFRPKLTSTLMRLERFIEMPVDKVKQSVRALIIDVDGTLLEPGAKHVAPAVLEKLKEIRDKMLVCIFADDMEGLPVLEQLGIPNVRNVPPKRDPRSFDVAIQLCLQNRHHRTNFLYPRDCAMVGDNFLTDGTCRKIGMHFIHVRPMEGNDGFLRTFTRNMADDIARFHDWLR